jgi:hypothetical protein
MTKLKRGGDGDEEVDWRETLLSEVIHEIWQGNSLKLTEGSS